MVIKMTKTITERKTTPSLRERADFLGSIRESFSLKKGMKFLKMAWTTNPKTTDSDSYVSPNFVNEAIQSRAEVQFRTAQAFERCMEQRKLRTI
jgi:hypothetical protein